MRFALIVALRFLREGRFQSLLIIVGVAAGVGVVTYISALIEGLQGNTIARTLGTQPHLTVKPLDEVSIVVRDAAAGETALREIAARGQRPRSIDNWMALQRELQATAGVRTVTPVASGSALARVRFQTVRSAPERARRSAIA